MVNQKDKNKYKLKFATEEKREVISSLYSKESPRQQPWNSEHIDVGPGIRDERNESKILIICALDSFLENRYLYDFSNPFLISISLHPVF